MLAHALAVLLLTSPSISDSQAAGAAFLCPASVRLACQRLAVAEEVLDPSETPWWFAKDAEFPSDLLVIRCRWRELRNAPRLWEGQWLPSREAAQVLLRFNRRHRDWLQAHVELAGQDAELLVWIAETDELYRVWDSVSDSQTSWHYVHVRRRELASLRLRIGPRAWLEQRLPPFVPVWRFREVR